MPSQAPSHPLPADRTVSVILSLGSNIEPRLGWIERAAQGLAALPGTRNVRRSPVYETAPVGVPDAFRGLPFLNAIVILETPLAPAAFSREIHALEDRLGRVRGGERGAPRTIDIDIIAFGGLVSDDPGLTLPHPRAAARGFVLRPLADLLPDYTLPGHSRTVAELLRQLPAGGDCAMLPRSHENHLFGQ